MAFTSTQLENAAGELAATGLPPDLVEWLAQLKLLNGLPFNYLVPDEKFLPTETLRFFQVDPDWVNSLADGALSIGRHFNGAGTPPATIHSDIIHHRMLHTKPNAGLQNIRRRQLSLKDITDPLPPVPVALSGFILRSAVVKGWKSMDVIGYAKGSSPFDYEQGKITTDQINNLTILRLERLSDSVMLGIFQGSLYELVLHEPPEAIHFGLDEITPNVAKTLRVPTTNWDDPDTKYDTDTYQSVPLQNPFADATERVLDMVSLSKGLATNLAATGTYGAPGYYKANPGTDKNYKDHLVSSDFALEMVKGVGLVSFINDVVPPPPKK